MNSKILLYPLKYAWVFYLGLVLWDLGYGPFTWEFYLILFSTVVLVDMGHSLYYSGKKERQGKNVKKIE